MRPKKEIKRFVGQGWSPPKPKPLYKRHLPSTGELTGMELGTAVWGLSVIPTPFKISPSGVIHIESCRPALKNQEVHLDQLVWALRNKARGCKTCGATPRQWVKMRVKAFAFAGALIPEGRD